MTDLTYLRGQLSRDLIQEQFYQTAADSSGLFPLPQVSETWKANRIYLGEASEAAELLKANPPDCPVVLLLSGSGPIPDPACSSVSYLLSRLPLRDLQTRCQEIFSQYHSWTTLWASLASGGSNPVEVLERFSEHTHSHLFLLNDRYQVICGSRKMYFPDPAAELFLQKHAVNREQQKDLGLPPLFTEEAKEGVLSGVSYSLQTLPVRPGKASLWLWCSAADCLDQRALTDLLILSLGPAADLSGQPSACARFLSQIMEQDFIDNTKMEQLIEDLPYPLENFLSCLVIRFSEKAFLPYSYLQFQLEEIFPHTNMGVFRGDIVLFYSQPVRPAEKLNFSYEKLNALLAEFSACAAVSNATRHKTYLRTEYLMACDTLRLAAALKPERNPSRIFHQEEYGIFGIIDLCAKQFIQTHRHEDIVYLVHPAIIRLCRYDLQHHSNLREVMFYYLISDRSLNKTAQKMYMHRNTVLNKVNKILEIIEIPLDDGYLQHRLILSCLILQYYEKVMGRNIRL